MLEELRAIRQVHVIRGGHYGFLYIFEIQPVELQFVAMLGAADMGHYRKEHGVGLNKFEPWSKLLFLRRIMLGLYGSLLCGY